VSVLLHLPLTLVHRHPQATRRHIASTALGSFDVAGRKTPDVSKLRQIRLADVAAMLGAPSTAAAPITITSVAVPTITSPAAPAAAVATGGALVAYNAKGVLCWVGGATDVTALTVPDAAAVFAAIEVAIRSTGQVTQGLHDR
jgi:ABC-type Fe3+-hydroxamate transport system substrate-binding protein